MERHVKIILTALLFALPMLVDGAGNKFISTPSNYNLEIITSKNNFKDNPSAEDLRFKGKVTIDLEIEKNTTEAQNKGEIKLNIDPNTTIDKCILKVLNGTWTEISTNWTCSDDKKFLTLKFENYTSQFPKYQLSISFENSLRNDMTGFYRSSYVDSSNKTRWLLTTHLEPVYARQVFPCFDQPDLKAIFNISITAPKEMKTVLCNTPTSKQVVGDNQIITCEPSLRMSTYLVAFTVSDFIGTEPEKFQSNYPSSSERVLTTYGREDIIKKGDGKLAQITGKAALTKLGEYLNLGYAFKKVDQVGIPDFSAGAMENWGHISFREKSLFFNATTGSTLTKQANVLTITHELVHQWFGNLVTLESWDYIWLNEAFANYLEYVIASKYTDPATSDWELMNQFVVNEMHERAFETDGLNSSKPLNNKITDESLILPSFNDIPYSKGASVLRMWERALGSDKFKKSLQEYVNKRSLKTSNPKILYQFFKEEAQMKEEFFSTWTEQAGYPLVEVKKNKNGTYEFSQKRFLWENSSSDNIWYIPISYNTDNVSNKFNFTPTNWLYNETLKMNISGKWIIVNNQQSGYYRVNYDKENWEALSKVLETNSSTIHELNRAQIINDVFSLARSLQKNYVQYETAFNLAKYLKKENNFFAWKAALNAFDFLQNKLRGESADKFKEYVLDLVKPHFKSLDTAKSTHIEKLKNTEISRWACSLGLDACQKEALKLFNDSSYEKLPDVQSIVLCTAVKVLPDAWNKVFEKYSQEKDSSLKIMYITALGCTENKTKAEEFLNKTLEEKCIIRAQDLSYVLSSVYNGNLKHVDLAFNFIDKNYKEIAKKYGGINPLGKALVGISRKISSEETFKKLESLVKKVKEGEEGKAAKDSLDNALNIAKSNVEWVKKREADISKYLNAGSFVTYSLSLVLLSLVTVFQF